jgi:esterase/lipase superfamily enzyme
VKASERWHSDRLQQDIALVRWGVAGTPVLLFSTAGGDAEEVERHHLVGACGDLLAAGRVKIYSCDGVASRTMMAGSGSPEHQMWLLNQFQQCVRHEIVPAIYADSGGTELPVIAAGASIGAFNALAVLCRFPDVFSHAICMSGTYDLQPLYDAGSATSCTTRPHCISCPVWTNTNSFCCGRGLPCSRPAKGNGRTSQRRGG